MIMISCHGPQSGSQQKTEFFEFPNRLYRAPPLTNLT